MVWHLVERLVKRALSVLSSQSDGKSLALHVVTNQFVALDLHLRLELVRRDNHLCYTFHLSLLVAGFRSQWATVNAWEYEDPVSSPPVERYWKVGFLWCELVGHISQNLSHHAPQLHELDPTVKDPWLQVLVVFLVSVVLKSRNDTGQALRGHRTAYHIGLLSLICGVALIVHEFVAASQSLFPLKGFNNDGSFFVDVLDDLVFAHLQHPRCESLSKTHAWPVTETRLDLHLSFLLLEAVLAEVAHVRAPFEHE
jgi:hypothetical protein